MTADIKRKSKAVVQSSDSDSTDECVTKQVVKKTKQVVAAEPKKVSKKVVVSSDSSSEEDAKPSKASKKVDTPVIKKVVKKVESSDESSEEEKPVAKKAAPAKKAVVESSDESSEEEKPVAKKAAPAPVKKAVKKVESSDESSSEEEKPVAKKAAPAKKPVKMADSSDESSEEEKPVAKKAAPAKKAAVESSDESSEDEKPVAKKVVTAPAKKVVKKAESSDESSEDEKPVAKKAAPAKKAAVESSDESSEEKPAAKKSKKTELTPAAADGDILEVFIGSLAWTVTEDQIKESFGECGEIEKVRLIRGEDGKSRGIAFITFTNTEAVKKCCEWNGKEAWGRTIKVSVSQKKANVGAAPGVGNKTVFGVPDPSTKPANCMSVFVSNVPFDTEIEAIKAHFKDCGAVSRVNIMKDQQTGKPRGFGYINFETTEGVDAAVKLSGSNLNGRNIRVDYGKSKEEMKGKGQ